MDHVQENAAEAVRGAIDALKDSNFTLEMDGGRRIQVAIRCDRQRRRATVDFTGTSAQQPDNFNAPRPVTNAAVLYCFRTIVDADIPMNAGCLEPVDIVLPNATMLSPEYPAAVVAGAHTSRRKFEVRNGPPLGAVNTSWSGSPFGPSRSTTKRGTITVLAS